MTWQIFLAFSVLATAGTTLVQRLLAREDNDSIALAIAFQLSVGFFILIYGLFTHSLNFTGILNYWPNLILMVILYGGFNILVFTALKNMEASEFTILLQTRTVWTIIFSMIFLRETFSFKSGIGTALILVSVLIVTELNKKISFRKAEIMTLLAAMGVGLAFVNDAYIINHTNYSSYLTTSFLVTGIALLVVFPKTVVKFTFLNSKEGLTSIGLSGFLYAIAAITTFVAYRMGINISIISPLSQTATIVTVILAIILLKEKDNINKKILAAAVSFIGVLLLV